MCYCLFVRGAVERFAIGREVVDMIPILPHYLRVLFLQESCHDGHDI